VSEARIRRDGLAARTRPGDGPPILWLHGYTLDATVWDELWDLLPGWTHVGLELPGHGGSAPMDPAEGLGAMARRIARFAGVEGARRLAAISFGGMVALQAAIECPDAFDLLALGSPVLGGGPVDPASMTCNLELLRLHRERGPGPWLRERWMSCPPDIFRGARAHPALFARLERVVERHSWAEMASGAMAQLSDTTQPPADLARIRARTLVLVGEEDMASFRRSAELIRRAVPHCRRLYLPECGHLTVLERPERAAPLLQAHFAPDSDG
jgi:2-succinyl-6-hydroxy-2,4-cyclohexadiene-1-carboxylate synthase